MWEFRSLSASKGKTVVNLAATKFKALDKDIQTILIWLGIWLVLCLFLYANNTESDAIDLEYYDEVGHTDTERLA